MRKNLKFKSELADELCRIMGWIDAHNVVNKNLSNEKLLDLLDKLATTEVLR